VDLDLTKQVLTALERRGVHYAVFGAVALNIHGFVRATEDLDLFVAPGSENIAALKEALSDVFKDPAIAEISAEDLLGDYPAVQYVPPTGDFHLDILTRLGEAFLYADLEVERVRFGSLEVSVVSPRTLYLMKKDTVRPKDRMDAEVLRAMFKVEDP
jgi:hypothetical protein